MTPERFQRIDALISRVLERDAADRAGFLDEACAGDDELRREVESLLAADAASATYLERPAAERVAPGLADGAGAPEEDAGAASAPRAVGRYLVERELGSGGMGSVYAAYDPELGRRIAVKLIHPEPGRADPAQRRGRLLREAQALARVAHPNVVAIHDVGTFEDQVFIAMEYVEGATLTRWLAARRRSCAEIVAMLAQAGRGLAAAHAQGIVHRDFKPDNVWIGEDGRARVLDFGLARAAWAGAEAEPTGPDGRTPDDPAASRAAAAREPLTEPGKLVGTPAYMAPEQLRRGPVDARTDQFSFCVALHQALHGALPFDGDAVGDVLTAIDRRRIREGPDARRVPARLGRVLRRGLSPDPADRFDSMDRLLEALERRPVVTWRRAAVAGALALLAAAALVRREPWRRDADRIGMGPTAPRTRAEAVRKVDPLAYEAYTRGRYFWNKRSAEGFRKAIAYFEEAIARDPGYAVAYAALADTYDLLAMYDLVPSEQALPETRKAALRALELDEGLAEAHTSLARYYENYERNWAAAEREYRRAIELNPGYATGHDWYSTYLSAQGRHEEALAEARKAHELDPFSLTINTSLGMAESEAGREAIGIERLRETIEMDPRFGYAHFQLGRTYLRTQAFADAVAEFRKAAALSPSMPRYQSALANAYGRAGQKAEALRILRELEHGRPGSRVSWTDLAIVRVGLGQDDQAFAALDRALAHHEWRLVRIDVEPMFDPLRQDPRFAGLLRRIGLP